MVEKMVALMAVHLADYLVEMKAALKAGKLAVLMADLLVEMMAV